MSNNKVSTGSAINALTRILKKRNISYTLILNKIGIDEVSKKTWEQECIIFYQKDNRFTPNQSTLSFMFDFKDIWTGSYFDLANKKFHSYEIRPEGYYEAEGIVPSKENYVKLFSL